MIKKIKIFNFKVKKREKKIESFFGIFTSLLAVFLAMLVGGIVIIIAGANPILAYQHLLYGAFGNTNNIAETLTKTTPLLIAGLGLSISFRSKLINIGAEGQMIIGAIFATVVALALSGAPGFIILIASIIAGFIGGALFGFIPGIMKAKLGTPEIIIGVMLNYIAVFTLSFLLDGPLKDPEQFYPQSAMIDKSAWLPTIVSGTRLHVGFIIGLVLIVAYYLLMYRLPLGFKIKTVGYNPRAAKYAGMKVSRYIVIAMVLSGGLAGLAGMSETFGIHFRLYNEFTAGYGFDAIAVALLGQFNPIGVLFGAIYFAALRVGANSMQSALQVPVSVVYIIQGLSVLFILTDKFFQNYIVSFMKKRKKTSENVKVEVD